MAFFGKHTTRDRFLSRKSFGRAHDVVGAKEVSKMLVLHEFLNLCASRAKIYYKAEASQISLVNTLFIRYTHGDSRPTMAARLQVLVLLYNGVYLDFSRSGFVFSSILFTGFFSQIVMILIVHSN